MTRKLLIIVPVVLALSGISLFMPARQVTIEGIGTLSFETTVTLTVGQQAAYASPGSQYARPDSDIDTSGWESTPLYQKIDEVTADDGDYIRTLTDAASPTQKNCEVGLSDVTDPQSSSGHIVRTRCKTNSTFGSPWIEVELRQGTTVIAEWQYNPGSSYATSAETLTSEQADSITDYSDLRLHFIGYHPYGQMFRNFVSWAEFEVPEAAGCVEDISNTPGSHNFGTVSESLTYTTGLTKFAVTNNSGGAIDISIKGTDMTNGIAWTLSDTCTPGPDTYGLKAGLEGGDYTIIVKKNSPYNNLVENLADSATQNWGLKLWTPTSFSDGVAKSGTVTLTATCT